MITKEFNESRCRNYGANRVWADIHLYIAFGVVYALPAFDADGVMRILDKIEKQISDRPHDSHISKETIRLNAAYSIKPDIAEVYGYLAYDCTMCLDKHDDAERTTNTLYDEIDYIFSRNFYCFPFKRKDPAKITIE